MTKEPEVNTRNLEFGYSVRTTQYGPREGYHKGTIYWSGLDVEILKDGNKIGEYRRNYTSLFNTFVPFRQGDREYALYSKNYTATRVMSLPDCKDICGEDPASNGFCPTDYYVPTIEIVDIIPEDQRVEGEDTFSTEKLEGRFGFVAGCVWGDDRSWKIQYLDLSRTSEGILLREEKFGYLELPNWLNLKEAIKFECYERNFPYVHIAAGLTFDMRTGEAMDVHFKIGKD